MKLAGLSDYKSLYELVLAKIDAYGKNPTQFSTLFKLIFSEGENVIAETMRGYKIEETTYGEAKKHALNIAVELEKTLSAYPKDTMIGLNMANSLRWIETFWGILLAGYKPLLINSHLPKSVTEKVIAQYDVRAVISDSLVFSSCKTYEADEITGEDTDRGEESFVFGTEVVFMSSGTQGDVKLCAYNAECFYHQISDTYYLVKNCPQIRKGCEGKIKQLALLPFYHVFGFIAVYLWFGFFSRTFVFLKDASPQTLLNTVRRHKVTHVFAVPLVWETIYKKTTSVIKSKSGVTARRFDKCLDAAKKSKLGKKLAHRAFAEVREGIFGDSIRFLITGGSQIDAKTTEFFNAIGYHLANGYGMTEIGVTSVELSSSDKERNTLSVGEPFRSTRYKCENGRLYVKSPARAARILYGGKEIVTDFDEWFDTGDMAVEKNGKYFIRGRADDLLVDESGENVNPDIVEELLRTDDADDVCLFRARDGAVTLLVYCPKVYLGRGLAELRAATETKIKENRLEGVVRRIELTDTPLLSDGEFKISRKKIAERYSKNRFNLLSDESVNEGDASELEKKLKRLFSRALQIDEKEIGTGDDFFSDLNGNSLEYFSLVEMIKEEMNVVIPVEKAQKLSTVSEMDEYIRRRDL